MNLVAVLLVLGVMDLRAMAAVTAAITAERLAPAGERVARVIGAVVAAAGLFHHCKADRKRLWRGGFRCTRFALAGTLIF